MTDKSHEFSLLVNNDGQPVAQFHFDNGWTASIVFRCGMDALTAQSASFGMYPTGCADHAKFELWDGEASAQEVATWLAQVAEREPIE